MTDADRHRDGLAAAVAATVRALPDAARWMSAIAAGGPVSTAAGLDEPGVLPVRTPEGAKDDETLWGAAVARIIEQRACSVEQLGLPPAHSTIGLLLCYWPADNLFDGAAEVASTGFFDADNVPLADSWVGWIPGRPTEDRDRAKHGMLLSWVPPAWFTRVGHGISVNPEGCISWLYPDVAPWLCAAFEAQGVQLPTRSALEQRGLRPPTWP